MKDNQQQRSEMAAERNAHNIEHGEKSKERKYQQK